MDFIKEVEHSVTKPVFVRLWLAYISERYELSEELIQLLENIPYKEPSEDEVQLLNETTRTYFYSRPLVYGIVTSNLLLPEKFTSHSDINESDHIFAYPEDDSTAKEIPLLYPESVERLLKDVLELTLIKTAFAKELPKKTIVCVIHPTKEEVHKAAVEYVRKNNIRVGGAGGGAVNHIEKYIHRQLTRIVEKEMDYEIWELMGYETNALREPLKDLMKANVNSYMEELKAFIRRMGKESPDEFIRYLHSGKPIMSYCMYPTEYLRRFGYKDPDKYRNYLEGRFIKDYLDLKLAPEMVDMSVIYKAIRDRRFKEVAEDLLVHIYRHVVRNDIERKQIFTEILFKIFRTNKRVLGFIERNKLKDMGAIVGEVIELRNKASHLRDIHRKVMDLFTEEGFPRADNPVIEKAYSTYLRLLNKEVVVHLRDQIHASVENLVWFFMDRDDLEKAETLLRKAIDAGVVSPLFIEITGILGLEFFERFSENEDRSFLEKSLRWYDEFYELLYLEEISGNLEKEIELFAKFYELPVNYLSVKLYNLISEEVGPEDELDEEWEKMQGRIEFIEGLFSKYGTKPYEKSVLAVGDYLLVKVKSEEFSPEGIFGFYLTMLKLYKVVYLLYSEEGWQEAKSILKEVISNTPDDTLEEIDLSEFFNNWGLDYDDLLAEL